MPELPEVEVVRAGLAPAAIGSRIAAVSVFDERALTRHPAGAADFVGRLEGRTFAGAERRGKFLWLPLDTGDSALIAHLGMSGQMLLRSPDAAAVRHERIRIHLEHVREGHTPSDVEAGSHGCTLPAVSWPPHHDCPGVFSQRFHGEAPRVRAPVVDDHYVG